MSGHGGDVVTARSRPRRSRHRREVTAPAAARGPTGTRMACAAPCTRVYSPTRRFGPGPTTLVHLRGGHAAARPGRGRRRHGPAPGLVSPPARPGVVPAPGLPGRPGPAPGPSGAGPGERAHRAAPRAARSPCWPTCAPGAGCSTPSASTSAPTERRRTGVDDRWWPKSRTRPGTSATPTWSVPRGRHRFAKELHVSPFLPTGRRLRAPLHRPGRAARRRPRRAPGRPSACSPPPSPCVAAPSTAARSAACSGTTRP